MIFAFLKKFGWLLGAICCLCAFVGGCAVPWILHKESVLSVVAYMLIEIPIGGWGLIYCVKKYLYMKNYKNHSLEQAEAHLLKYIFVISPLKMNLSV